MNLSNAELKATRLTKDGRQKFDPVFVRGGEEVVYTVLESPTQMSLMRLKVADGSVERLHPQATTSEFEAAFTPDGRYYCFVQSRANLNLKLVIRDTKQSKDAIFDPGGGFAGMRRPTIAPDGSRVLFSMADAAGQQIYSVNIQGQDPKTLTKSALNHWPAYSPNGKQVAFGSSRDGDFDLYVMDADGGNVRRLTKSPGIDMRPAWSPDSKRITFTSNRDGNYEIYVMDSEGANQRRITHNSERDDFPAWHPDGQRLVIVCERAGRSDLYLVGVG
jgi:Tol biopolymer transport system component